MNFSTATTADAETISQLVNSAYRGDYSKKGWTTEADLLGGQRTDKERILEMISDPNATVELLLIEHKIMGCVYLKKESETVYLGMLTVEPTQQTAGYGKALMTHAQDWAKGQNAKTIRMTVIKQRTELITYYERQGFSLTGKTEPFPIEDPRFGVPKRKDLIFVELVKKI